MTYTDVANAALGMICEQPLASIDDSTVAGGWVKRYFGDVVRQVLSRYPWRCARKRRVLQRDAEKPAFEWAWNYRLPADFLRVCALNGVEIGEASAEPFEIEGRVLLTNAPEARLVYVADVTGDVGAFAQLDALCCEAIAVKLAQRLCYPLTAKAELSQSLAAEFERVMLAARQKSTRDAGGQRVSYWQGGDAGAGARQGGALFY
jgi:hypothetical protein